MDAIFGEKKYISIQEAGEYLQLPPSTLRYWEKVIPELKPEKNKNGVRYYQRSDIQIIQKIIYWTKTRGLSLEETAKKIKQPKRDNDELIQHLYDLKRFLEDLRKML